MNKLTTQQTPPAAEVLPAAAHPGELRPLILGLPNDLRRSLQKVACAHCPTSLWFQMPNEVKCFCREMHLLTWTTSEPIPILNCDGLLEPQPKQ